MATQQDTPRPHDDGQDWVEANRDQIEREADSDARDAWVFQRLLDSLEEGGS